MAALGSHGPIGLGSFPHPRTSHTALAGNPIVEIQRCFPPRSSVLQDWPKHWRAKLKRSPGDLSLVTSLVSHLLSLPDHPISQLLKKLQCAVYSALYPVVSRAAICAVPAPGSCSLPPEANGLLAPGSRRLRSSQSLYCMLSPSEPSAAPRALDGPPSIPSIPTLHSGTLDREADGSPAGPSSPLVGALPHLPDKDSSFEDLEQFLAMSEPQTPGAKREPLLECLKSTVKDIHNAIDCSR